MIGQPTTTKAEISFSADARWLRRRVLAWFRQSGRDYPWRKTDDPYAVLIAELLLQRTRADLVERVYVQFMSRFPTARTLASAAPTAVLKTLKPLGFEHRNARVLALARVLVERHGGSVPSSTEDLLALPGVGRYIANAVGAIAFNRREPLLDPNVIRLLERLTGQRSERARPRDDPRLWQLLEDLLPRQNARDFNLALVDLGATVCQTRPRCHCCPLNSGCVTFRENVAVPSDVS